MAKTSAAVRAARTFKTLTVGTPVTWPYRGTHGWGYIAGIASLGSDNATTRYRVRQVDNHLSATGSRENAEVIHTGAALSVSTTAAVQAAANRAKAQGR